MLSKRSKIILSILFLVILGSYFFISKDIFRKQAKKSFADLKDRERVQIEFNTTTGVQDQKQTDSVRLWVEVVNTQESTEQGLSGRTEIGSDGMLFIFPQKQMRYFWMKDMQFDIDILWIADDIIVGVLPAIPKPEAVTPDNRLKTYGSLQEVNMVLELKAGDAQKYGLNSGDVVQLVE